MSIQHIASYSEFESLLKENKNVILDFHATWCGPCKKVSPILDEAVKNNDTVVFAKIDIDEVSELAQKYEITGVPTLVYVSEEKEIDRVVGFSVQNIQKLIEKASNGNKVSSEKLTE
jgi:thioredoxin 1